MASIRRQILDNLVDSLSNISQANGFNTDVVEVSKKFIDPESVQSPNIFVSLGKESRQQVKDEQFNYDCQLDAELLISIGIRTDIEDQGTLSDAAEDIIEDIDDYLEHNKVSDYCCTLNQIEGMQSFGISEIEPYLDDTSNRTYIIVTISITYLKL